MNHLTVRSNALAVLAVLAVVSLCAGCGAKGASRDRSSTTTTRTDSAVSVVTGNPTASVAPASADVTTSGGTPSAWPAGVPLPTAVDPNGASIPNSLVTGDYPAVASVVLFTFAQGENTALQSAFTGVGKWAEETFEDFPNGTPCVKDEASSAALSVGSWSCDGMLPDGDLIQIATSVNGGRMSLDVVVKSR